MLQTLKHSRLSKIILATLAFCGTISVSAIAIGGPSDAILDFFDQNNIYYYNPLGNTACNGDSAGLLPGDTIEEKIWNYFVNANINGVSNNASVIAGVMGNLMAESGYDPFIKNSSGYTGIYQTSFSKIAPPVEAVYGSSYWRNGNNGDTSQYPEDVVVGAIAIELDYLTKTDSNWELFTNNLNVVSNTSGAEGAASYAELFLVTVERAVNGSDMLTDPQVQNFVNTRMYPSSPQYQNAPYQGAKHRAEFAKEIYEKYAANVPSGGSSTTSTNAGNCIHSLSDPFTQYSQSDSRWGSLMFGSGGIYGNSGSTIAASGCGPTSFAMIATALLGREVLPSETADIAGKAGMYVQGVGSSHVITKVLADHYGLEYEDIGGSDIDKITEYLKNGWMIHTSGAGTSPFTSGGHYIALRGVTADGKWLIADSAGAGKANTLEKEWEPSAILSAGMNTGNLKAVRATTGNACGMLSSCYAFGATGGLTDEQAEKLAAYYKTDEATAGYDMPAGTKWNCVSLSAWFVQAFTSIGKQSGAWGNGKDTAHNLHVDYNLPEGTEPQPFSIFSVTTGSTVCEDGHLCGHTGLVVRVDGDQVTTIEAAYGQVGYTEVVHHSLSDFTNTKYTNKFTYLGSIVDTTKLNSIIGN